MARTFITREFFPVNTPGFRNTFVAVYFDDVANTLVFINEKTGDTVATIGGIALTSNLIAEVVAAADPAYLASDGKDFGIGKILAIQNWKATGDGLTIQKITTTNNDRFDWIIIATEDVATGGIGDTPA